MIQRHSRHKLCLLLLFMSVFFCLYFSFNYYHVRSTRYVSKRKVSNHQIRRFWYLKNGDIRPDSSENARVWPEQLASDRITEQLMLTASTDESIVKTIFLPKDHFDFQFGSTDFKECPVNRCEFVKNPTNADAVLFKDSVPISRQGVPQSQIWILFVLESPFVSGFDRYGTVNWSATYRPDSEITTPYEKWVPYDNFIKEENVINPRNYTAGKTKMVAWFVSNCNAFNNRLQYARELKNYIDVDIYGRCGDLSCPRGKEDCFEMLSRDYKFYLAFENGNCRDYITEKFFVNGLGNDILPIVMGAHPDDYKRVAPEYSYIHVDDFPSARDLASYLHFLNSDDSLYNAYFKWKGAGEFINTRFYCRLCALLHTPREVHFYKDFRSWWSHEDICRKDSWKN